jgi:hypothetical protein
LGEFCTLPGKGIKIRGFAKFIAKAAKIPPPKIISQEKNNVRSLGSMKGWAN